MSPAQPTPPRTATAALLSELQDLKRLAPAGVRHSLADELFVTAWAAVLAGADDWSRIAYRTTARAVLYVLFPGVDAAFFRVAGLSADAVREVCTRACDRTLDGRTDATTRTRIREALHDVIAEFSGDDAQVQNDPDEARLLPCLQRLRTQPRAGATHPDHPRLVLSPPESHADHCLMTAVYASLHAAEYGADAGQAFVCGLAHHLHNAYLPDCGWAGELALEPYLQQTIDNCRAAALESFPGPLRERIRQALRHHESIATPEGKAISAGDVLDRVLDVKWRVRAAAVTEAKVLGDLDLVHPGPLKNFQTDLLNATGLWTTP